VMYNHIHHLPTLRTVDDRRWCPTPSPGYLKRGEYRGLGVVLVLIFQIQRPHQLLPVSPRTTIDLF
jgi:hypothetical protein